MDTNHRLPPRLITLTVICQACGHHEEFSDKAVQVNNVVLSKVVRAARRAGVRKLRKRWLCAACVKAARRYACERTKTSAAKKTCWLCNIKRLGVMSAATVRRTAAWRGVAEQMRRGGATYQAIADATGVTRQRIFQVIKGTRLTRLKAGKSQRRKETA